MQRTVEGVGGSHFWALQGVTQDAGTKVELAELTDKLDATGKSAKRLDMGIWRMGGSWIWCLWLLKTGHTSPRRGDRGS